jgi:hypothetical protein
VLSLTRQVVGHYHRELIFTHIPTSASFATSLSAGITDYQYENGRRYHAYRAGSKLDLPQGTTQR